MNEVGVGLWLGFLNIALLLCQKSNDKKHVDVLTLATGWLCLKVWVTMIFMKNNNMAMFTQNGELLLKNWKFVQYGETYISLNIKNLVKKMTHRVQLRGSLMSYGGLTVVSIDFFLLKKGLFRDNQLKSGFLFQLSQIFDDTTVVKAQTNNWAISHIKQSFSGNW